MARVGLERDAKDGNRLSAKETPEIMYKKRIVI
jgi:hypothetical protein